MGDIGEATSILISAEMELSIISIIVSCVDTILKTGDEGSTFDDEV